MSSLRNNNKTAPRGILPAPINVTLAEFKQAVFGDADPWLAADDGKGGGMFGRRASQCQLNGPGWGSTANYFSIGVLKAGAPTRANAYWESGPILAVDDVGEKCTADAVRDVLGDPSYIIMSSPASAQYGYILKTAVTDPDTMARLQKALTHAFFGGVDPGQEALVRYMRLPCGLNLKDERIKQNGGTPPAVTVASWNPECRFDWQDLAMALDTVEPAHLNGQTAWEAAAGAFKQLGQLSAHMPVAEAIERGDYIIEAFDKLGMLRGPQGSQGFYEVQCLWEATHTKMDDRTGWNPELFLNRQTGFVCHHSDSGADTSNDGIETELRKLLDARDGAGSFDALKAAGFHRQMAHAFPDPLPDDATMVAASALPASAQATVRTFDVSKGRLHERIAAGLRHLSAHGEVFQRAGRAVEIKHTPEPRIVTLSQPSQMADALSRACRCFKTKIDKNGQTVEEECDPPENLTKAMVQKVLGTGDPIDKLEAIVTAPFIDAAGEVVQVHGKPRYDVASGLWLDPADVDFLPVDDAECTRDDALKALEVLSYPISRYDFASETDKSVALASMLLPFARPSILLAPGIAIEAPLKGSGKTKLASLPAILATGEAPALIASPGRADELDKRLLASLLGGRSNIVIDNIADSDETWGTDTLCAAITANSLDLRPLGSSNAQTVKNRASVTVTGNNISYPGDVTRRFLVCRIEPRHASPHKRAFAFDPDTEVLQNRTKYVHAALTMLRAYIRAGSPPQSGATLGSFGEFTRLVRDALMWLGLPDVAEASAEDKADASPEQAALADVLDAWAGVPAINTGAHKASAIVKAAEEEAKNGRRALQDALTAVCGRLDSSVALGQWLGRNKGRPANGLLFNGGKDRKGVMVWSIDRLNATAPQPPPAQPAPEDDPIGTTDPAVIEDQEREQRIAEAKRVFAASPLGAERPN
jgi:hypothetical protein